MNTYQAYKQKNIRIRIVVFLIIGVLLYLSALGSQVNFSGINLGRLKTLVYLKDLFRPDWSAIPELMLAALQTILIAFLGTILGIIISTVFALMAANNINPRWLSILSKFVISLERSTSEVIIILLLIVVFGPGLFAGVLTLAIACIGMLGRLYAESIEEISPKSLESVRSLGGTRWQMIKYGVLPHVLASWSTYSILRFELNIRASVMLGAIGAGGIGYELIEAYYHLEYSRMSAAIISILALIFGAERFSHWARKKIADPGKLK